MMKLSKLCKKALVPLLAFPLLLQPDAARAAESNAGAELTQQASELQAFQEVLDYLEMYNIEGVEKDVFLENAIRGMVYSLDDPYSDYYTAEELKDFEDGVNQEYVGIGVTLRFTGNKLYVTDVLPDSPASAAGLKKGDIIAKVDGDPVVSGEDILKIQGEEHTKVTLNITRGGSSMTIPVERAHFSLPAVTGSYFSSGRIGYIAISSFSDTADMEFALELDKLRGQGMRSLVLDLRDNLGGYVDVAANIASYFMESGTLMYTADQSGELEAVTVSDGQDIGMPVVILTNELTASASEILTGALHDNGIATVVGAQTYGKARIQNVFTLSNGSSLKLTVLRYLTPNMIDFNHVGLKPDIEVINNPTAQLITGLYKAGARSMELKGSAASLSLNGVAFSGYVDTFQSGNNVYVPSRILAAMIKADTTWTSSNQKLTITNSSGVQGGFTIAANTVKLVDGEAYVEMHEFQKKFPELKWSYNQGTITLTR
ncbi:S41 family peptidase [Paenibacillus sp. M1]|uniref:S41 family peptidase n=1 Tax=Paenibacillus haidiansis TaxID=1574488 RepID=A0ABU7VZ11_9BACL